MKLCSLYQDIQASMAGRGSIVQLLAQTTGQSNGQIIL